MADFTKFRSSMGGFNRSDVTNYIETLCAEHKRALKRLQEENEDLSTRLTAAEDALAGKSAALEALEQKLAATEVALASTETALTEAMTMVEEQEALRAALEQPQSTDDADAPDYPALELEAYRRAEATERLAQERADRLRQRLSDLLDNVSARYEESGQELQVLTEDIRTNMKRLQDTLSDLELIFDETSGRFNTIEDEPLED